LRIKGRETRLTLQEHDDDDDDISAVVTNMTPSSASMGIISDSL